MKRCKDCYWQKPCWTVLLEENTGFAKDCETADDCPQYRRNWWKFGRPK